MRAGSSLGPPARTTGRAVAVAAVAKAPRRRAPPSALSSSSSSGRSSKRNSDPATTLPHAAPANGASAAAASASASALSSAAVVAVGAAPGTASVVLRPAPAAVLPPRAPMVAAEELPAAAAAAAAADATPPPFAFDADTSRDGWHRDGSFRVAMSPRPHEIDEFGVVNNTYYNTFMYAARYRYMTELGVPINAWQSRGVNSVTVRVLTTFRVPLRLSDDFYATSAVRAVSRSQVVLAEVVRRRADDAVVAFSEVICATVDNDFKVVRIPAEVRPALERGAARFAAGSEK